MAVARRPRPSARAIFALSSFSLLLCVLKIVMLSSVLQPVTAVWPFNDDYSYDDSGLPYDYDYGASFVLSYDQPFITNTYHNNTHNAQKTTLLLLQQRRTKTSACQTKWPRARDSTLTK